MIFQYYAWLVPRFIIKGLRAGLTKKNKNTKSGSASILTYQSHLFYYCFVSQKFCTTLPAFKRLISLNQVLPLLRQYLSI